MKKLLIFLVLMFFFMQLHIGCKSNGSNKEKLVIWEKIAPYFTPPKEFKNDYGDFRSPLQFYNGSPVKTVDEWQQRRQEIYDRWQVFGLILRPPVLKNLLSGRDMRLA